MVVEAGCCSNFLENVDDPITRNSGVDPTVGCCVGVSLLGKVLLYLRKDNDSMINDREVCIERIVLVALMLAAMFRSDGGHFFCDTGEPNFVFNPCNRDDSLRHNDGEMLADAFECAAIDVWTTSFFECPRTHNPPTVAAPNYETDFMVNCHDLNAPSGQNMMLIATMDVADVFGALVDCCMPCCVGETNFVFDPGESERDGLSQFFNDSPRSPTESKCRKLLLLDRGE